MKAIQAAIAIRPIPTPTTPNGLSDSIKGLTLLSLGSEPDCVLG